MFKCDGLLSFSVYSLSPITDISPDRNVTVFLAFVYAKPLFLKLISQIFKPNVYFKINNCNSFGKSKRILYRNRKIRKKNESKM